MKYEAFVKQRGSVCLDQAVVGGWAWRQSEYWKVQPLPQPELRVSSLPRNRFSAFPLPLGQSALSVLRLRCRFQSEVEVRWCELAEVSWHR